MKAQVGIIGGVLPGFMTRIHKDSVHRWNLWFPSAGVFTEVLMGRATGTQITFPPNTTEAQHTTHGWSLVFPSWTATADSVSNAGNLLATE